ncbi:hypothetical protein SY83_00630 [Paenibacillus swuensis]|uniref:Uncharacterized protein n=1 Tax=Paenibacillus swuensis TaxID=1178515 RepID=A0A172TDX3_9BACL|nr:hypothetical protein [Paenibacillus swuensis]ANE45107.1 hypothetical protein SY83_00630 [Paenibacillus swuensis]
MYPLHPLCEEVVNPHCGQMVCVMMKDGSRHVGVLSRLHNGQVILNDFDSPAAITQVQAPKKKIGKKAKNSKAANPSKSTPLQATTSGFGGPFGYGYGPGYGGFGGGFGGYGYGFGFGSRLAFDIAAIAFLLLLI